MGLMNFLDEHLGKKIESFAVKAKDTVQREMGKDVNEKIDIALKVVKVGAIVFGVAATVNAIGNGGHAGSHKVPVKPLSTPVKNLDGVRDVYFITNHYTIDRKVRRGKVYDNGRN